MRNGLKLKKVRGRRRGTPPPPIRPGPVGGHGEGRGRAVGVGMGCYTHPPVRSADGGDDCRRERPELAYYASAFKRARQLTACQRDREEPRVIARLHAKKNRALAAGASIRERLADLL